eukprot:XP_013974717.1 uncharacterized protein LOC106559725 [Canis lupus familiaris]
MAATVLPGGWGGRVGLARAWIRVIEGKVRVGKPGVPRTGSPGLEPRARVPASGGQRAAPGRRAGSAHLGDGDGRPPGGVRPRVRGASLAALPEGPGGNDSAGRGGRGGREGRRPRARPVRRPRAARPGDSPRRPAPPGPRDPERRGTGQRGAPRAGAGVPRAGRQETLGSEWKEVGGPGAATSPDITAQIRSFQAAAGRPGAAPARQPAPRPPRAAWAACERPGHRRAEPSRAEPSERALPSRGGRAQPRAAQPGAAEGGPRPAGKQRAPSPGASAGASPAPSPGTSAGASPGAAGTGLGAGRAPPGPRGLRAPLHALPPAPPGRYFSDRPGVTQAFPPSRVPRTLAPGTAPPSPGQPLTPPRLSGRALPGDPAPGEGGLRRGFGSPAALPLEASSSYSTGISLSTLPSPPRRQCRVPGVPAAAAAAAAEQVQSPFKFHVLPVLGNSASGATSGDAVVLQTCNQTSRAKL